MGLLLDLVGSAFIAGILILLLFQANTYQTNTRLASDSELQMQQNARTLADILSYDLRKVGYEYDGQPFIQVDSERICFYADMDRDGHEDIVTYFLGDTSLARSTPNPNDRVMIRVVNNDTIA